MTAAQGEQQQEAPMEVEVEAEAQQMTEAQGETGVQAEEGQQGAPAGSATAAEAGEQADEEDEGEEEEEGATLLDGLPETQKYVLAEKWGYSRVGADLPTGTTALSYGAAIPARFFEVDGLRAAAAVAGPLAVMAAGYAWMWYWHSICPVWQQAVAGVLIGTAYAGLFKVAHECARYNFQPLSAELQDLVGSLLMAPSLYAFIPWRLQTLHHTKHLNQ
ncbi:Omega-6 fatty acid desaturase, chloroplastic, partial [Tetrabaena socialis]